MWEDETPNYVEYFESEADLWAEIKSHDMNYKELWFEFIDATVQSETITVQPNSGVFVFLKHIHPFMVTAGASPESTALDIIGFTDGVDSPYCEDTCVGFALFVLENAEGEVVGMKQDDKAKSISFDYLVYAVDSNDVYYTFDFTIKVEKQSIAWFVMEFFVGATMLMLIIFLIWPSN